VSYIDLFDHEHVGHFAGLPIYRPLEPVVPQSPIYGEFPANTDNLVLGGGLHLEHPGLVFKNLNYIAACFIADWLEFCEDTESSIYSDKETDKWSDIIHGYLNMKDEFEYFETYHWSMRDYSDFYNDCKSNCMRSPFVETEQRNNFESWLLCNIGELVVFSYPELITEPEILAVAKKVDRFLYGNVSILPAGYPTDHLGRRTKDGQSEQGLRAFHVTKNV